MLKYLSILVLAIMAVGNAQAQIITLHASGIIQSMQTVDDDGDPTTLDPNYPISAGDSFTFTETLDLSVQGDPSGDGYVFQDGVGTAVMTLGDLEYDMNNPMVETDGTGRDAVLVLSVTGTAPNGDSLAPEVFFSLTGSPAFSSTLDSLRTLTPDLSTAAASIQIGSVNGYGSSSINAKITSFSISPSLESMDEESVPEPSTGALLLLGALAIGGGLRLKTSRSR